MLRRVEERLRDKSADSSAISGKNDEADEARYPSSDVLDPNLRRRRGIICTSHMECQLRAICV